MVEYFLSKRHSLRLVLVKCFLSKRPSLTFVLLNFWKQDSDLNQVSRVLLGAIKQIVILPPADLLRLGHRRHVEMAAVESEVKETINLLNETLIGVKTMMATIRTNDKKEIL